MKLIKGRELNRGDRVFVYYNLHRKCFSVKNLRTGLVVAHTDDITLDNVTFKVNQKGRERVLIEQRKNVHAGVVGEYTPQELSKLFSGIASYNPYKYGYFYDKVTYKPIEKAYAVRLVDHKVYYQS